MNFMTRLIRTFIAFMMIIVCNMHGHTQELRLESVAMETMTQTVPIQRKDLNGQICALVKVIMPGEKVVFEGSVIGECPYKTSEYWCYLSPGTKSLKIKYPNLKPLLVDFTEYFESGVKSNRIYNIVVKVPITHRDIHKGPLDGTFKLLEPKDVKLIYIHSSTGKRDYVPLQKVEGVDLMRIHYTTGSQEDYMKFTIPEAHEGDSLKLISSSKAFINEATEITLKDIVNGSIELKYPQKKKRKPFNVYFVDCLTNDTLPRFEISLFRQSERWSDHYDYIDSYSPCYLNTDSPADMWEKMEIDKTYIIKFNGQEHFNKPYKGIWDWEEKIEVKPYDESDIIVKVRSIETPALNFWIGTKERENEIHISPLTGSLPQYNQWLNKSNQQTQGTFYKFQGFPIAFPATFRFSAEGYETMQITFYETPPNVEYVNSLKNGKTVFMMKQGSASEIQHFEYRNGKLKKK